MRPARDTKARILDAAEELFAVHGYESTSMRSVTGLAGANLAAVHYHFGSKEALLEAVLARRLEPINRQRLEGLDAAGSGADPSLEDLLRAFFEPAFRELGALGSAGHRFIRLAGRLHSDVNPEVRRIFLGTFRDVIARFVPAFRRALPGVDDAGLHWRLHFMIGAMAHTLAWIPHDECAVTLGIDAFDPSEALQALIAFCTAGMRAAAPAGTTA
ncbi:MAG: TetR/AcrR family transcriptional regulator [Acidobacteriota bacterium]|jgi:AcrR family transcriptional regulator